VCLVRPSVIAASHREPFPGWTDSLSAAGGLSLLTGLGIINYLPAAGSTVLDVIPVDLVTNQIILGSAYAPRAPQSMQVYHCSTSQQNPLSLDLYKNSMVKGLRTERMNKQIGPISMEFVPNRNIYKLKLKVFDDIPMQILSGFSKLPFVGNKKFEQ